MKTIPSSYLSLIFQSDVINVIFFKAMAVPGNPQYNTFISFKNIWSMQNSRQKRQDVATFWSCRHVNFIQLICFTFFFQIEMLVSFSLCRGKFHFQALFQQHSHSYYSGYYGYSSLHFNSANHVIIELIVNRLCSL